MDDTERLILLVQARGDQAIAASKSRIEDFERVTRVDPASWTADDRMVALQALYTLIGLIKEGRI